jgi:SMI1 / KNR4 family (SUKH-1)
MLVKRIATWGEATFNPPATEQQLLECEQALGHLLPDGLRAVLAETNGIEGEYGIDVLWSTERIAVDNKEFRSNSDIAELYMPFDPLVFFADAGDGNQFGVSLRGNLEIYEWHHENDSRVWVAPTVLRFIEDFMTGKLDGDDEADEADEADSITNWIPTIS